MKIKKKQMQDVKCIIVIIFFLIFFTFCKKRNIEKINDIHKITLVRADIQTLSNMVKLDSIVYYYSRLNPLEKLYITRILYIPGNIIIDNYYLYKQKGEIYLGNYKYNTDTIIYQPYYPKYLNDTSFFNFYPLVNSSGYMTLIRENIEKDSVISKYYTGVDYGIYFENDVEWVTDNKDRIIEIRQKDEPIYILKKYEKISKLPDNILMPTKAHDFFLEFPPIKPNINY